MAEGTKVGEAYVELSADPRKLEAALDVGAAKIRTTYETFEKQGVKATDKASGGFAKLGHNIKGTLRPITSLVGGVTAAIGTFGLFLSLGERIGRTIFGLNDKGRTATEEAVAGGVDAGSSLLMRASGVSPPDAKIEAEKDRLDRMIEERRQKLRANREFVKNYPDPEASFLADPSTITASRELADLEQARARITGGEVRLQRTRSVRTPAAAHSISGLSAGSSEETLRLLRAIQMNTMRRDAE